MWQYLQTPIAQAILWTAFALTLSVIAWYFVGKLRGQNEEEGGKSTYLTKFREMEQRGVLSDAEFRTIKTALGSQIQDEEAKD
jgi:hypothetical protein